MPWLELPDASAVEDDDVPRAAVIARLGVADGPVEPIAGYAAAVEHPPSIGSFNKRREWMSEETHLHVSMQMGPSLAASGATWPSLNCRITIAA